MSWPAGGGHITGLPGAGALAGTPLRSAVPVVLDLAPLRRHGHLFPFFPLPITVLKVPEMPKRFECWRFQSASEKSRRSQDLPKASFDSVSKPTTCFRDHQALQFAQRYFGDVKALPGLQRARSLQYKAQRCQSASKGYRALLGPHLEARPAARGRARGPKAWKAERGPQSRAGPSALPALPPRPRRLAPGRKGASHPS